MRARFGLLTLAVLALAAAPRGARAWGPEGHAVVAKIAIVRLTPKAAASVKALLSADTDTSTPPDIEATSSWADSWKTDHPETREWHFVDIDLNDPDPASACFGFPVSAKPASAGPRDDCIIGRIKAFERELADPKTDRAERLLALKFLLHLVGDLHQPLHAVDNQDKGGNCVAIALGGARTVNLHAYWDTIAVEALSPDTNALAGSLAAKITTVERKAWEQGDAGTWAWESFYIAKTTAYAIGSRRGCGSNAAPLALPPGYDAKAQAAVAIQLQKAGVRLALILNRALGQVEGG